MAFKTVGGAALYLSIHFWSLILPLISMILPAAAPARALTHTAGNLNYLADGRARVLLLTSQYRNIKTNWKIYIFYPIPLTFYQVCDNHFFNSCRFVAAGGSRRVSVGVWNCNVLPGQSYPLMEFLGNSLASLSITSLRLLAVSWTRFSSNHLVAVSVRLRLTLRLGSL